MSQAAAQSPHATTPDREAAVIPVSRTELPLACPRPRDALWNMHPRVYLAIEDEPGGESVCPYCGAHYKLSD